MVFHGPTCLLLRVRYFHVSRVEFYTPLLLYAHHLCILSYNVLYLITLLSRLSVSLPCVYMFLFKFVDFKAEWKTPSYFVMLSAENPKNCACIIMVLARAKEIGSVSELGPKHRPMSFFSSLWYFPDEVFWTSIGVSDRIANYHSLLFWLQHLTWNKCSGKLSCISLPNMMDNLLNATGWKKQIMLNFYTVLCSRYILGDGEMIGRTYMYIQMKKQIIAATYTTLCSWCLPRYEWDG